MNHWLSVQPAAVGVFMMTPGRMWGSLAVVVALTGLVVGSRALARHGRRESIVALMLGPIGLVIGTVVVGTAGGGLGTGRGLGGGVVAMIVGLIGTGLGALALARSRRSA